MVKKQIIKSKEMPTGVKVLSVLGYIGAAFTLLAGLAMIFGASFISGMLPSGVLPMMGGALIGVGLVLMGLFFIVFAVLDYFIARGLWKGQNWARILVLVFTVLGVLGSLMSFNLISLIIDGVIIWYLGFNKESVAYFK